ncbi:uncharacterized protein LOC116322589 [Oreochromis aureus]|uniref:uncharacterized protein LOC116322589 n=1 Tax=Oreochromis aureus TaxID=47969 RepID=UPI001952D4B2|nr:uncharacterized protein LOC116322589 [Oreochromis aureus]
MTMDADQWSEEDNTYEAADTLGIDYSATRSSREQQPSPVFRGRNREELKNQRAATNATLPNIGNQSAATNRPPPLRYMTIRWPGFNANKGKNQPPEFVFFRNATVCLAVLCILLIIVLICVSIACATLAGNQMKLTEESNNLREENNILTNQLDNLRNVSIAAYHVSSDAYPACLAGKTFFVLNYEVLDDIMTECYFYLHKVSMDDGGCNSTFSWRCARTFP